MALVEGFAASIRRRWASMTSRPEACLDLRASARPVALILHNSVPVVLVPARHHMARYAA